MMYNFKKIILHNFGSYSHAELDLQDKGFCLVSGQNNFENDNAKSNGSGKSFIWDAIIWVLTGTTGRGVSKGLKNLYCGKDEEMYVELTFDYNNDSYVLRRGEN